MKRISDRPHSVLTRDVNTHSTLRHSYTDTHRGKLIADGISNSDHITLVNTPTRVPNTTLQQTYSRVITKVTHQTIRHRGQLNTHYYHQTTYALSRQLTYNRTTDYSKTDNPIRSDHNTPQHTHCQHFFYKHHTDDRQATHTDITPPQPSRPCSKP